MAEDFKTAREAMVREQLIPRGIHDKRVIEAMLKVPRHEFIAPDLWSQAYNDYPLPTESGQTISQPYIVALMTELLGLSGTEKVLEIGTGAGYQTAILAELANFVYSIERFENLAMMAKKNLEKLNYKNVNIKTGDGTKGWPEFSPYDRIIVTASAPDIPKPLKEQLKESGKMVIPVGGTFGQDLILAEKLKGELKITSICGCVFVPLVGEFGWQ